MKIRYTPGSGRVEAWGSEVGGVLGVNLAEVPDEDITPEFEHTAGQGAFIIVEGSVVPVSGWDEPPTHDPDAAVRAWFAARGEE